MEDNRIIISANEPTTCPKCGHRFALQEGVAQKAIDAYVEAYEDQVAQDRQALTERLRKEAERHARKAQEETIAELKAAIETHDAEKLKLKTQIQSAREKAALEARAETETALKELREDLEDKNLKLEDMRKQEMALRTQARELEDQKRDMALQIQRQTDEAVRAARNQLDEQFRRREAELNKKITDAQRANEDLKRKLEQGSQQLQGEAFELELEAALGAAFPFDEISPVKTGARGADIIHTVRTRGGNPAGRILWEAKRAEHWSNAWTQKLKDDQREAGSDLAVLVSRALPQGIDGPFQEYEGVWLVRPDMAVPLAGVLRNVLTESHKQRVVSDSRHEKADALFDYLTGNQFAQKVRGVVDAYGAMRDDLEREKAAYARIWKKREQQIERITTNMLGMCGEIQGLADNALPQLEDIARLPGGGEED